MHEEISPDLANRIDVHFHYVPQEYRRLIANERGLSPDGVPLPAWDPDTTIGMMDRLGIATGIMSISSPGVFLSVIGKTRSLARSVNETAARVIAEHPDRFGDFASLPLPDIDGSLEEIAYAFDVLKLDGVVMMTNFGGVYLGDTQLAPVFDELNRRKAVVYIHPTSPACWQQTALGYPTPMIEFPFDSTRAVVNLILSGTIERCPDLRIIVSHAGGTLPFLARRIALVSGANPDLRRLTPAGVAAYLRRLYYDVALSTGPNSLEPLLEMTDRTHVVYGSDYPFAPEAVVKSLLINLQQSKTLSASDLGCIGRTNALQLFPRLEQRLWSKVTY